MKHEWILECSGDPARGTCSTYVMADKYTTGVYEKALRFFSREDALRHDWQPDPYVPVRHPADTENGSCACGQHADRVDGRCYLCRRRAERERAAAPAPPPVPASLAGVRVNASTLNEQAHDAVANMAAAMMRQQEYANARYQQQSTQQGLGGEPRADVVALRAELAAMTKARDEIWESFSKMADNPIWEKMAAMPSGTSLADVLGERRTLALRVSELETDLAFWKREAIRLKGGRR